MGVSPVVARRVDPGTINSLPCESYVWLISFSREVAVGLKGKEGLGLLVLLFVRFSITRWLLSFIR